VPVADSLVHLIDRRLFEAEGGSGGAGFVHGTSAVLDGLVRKMELTTIVSNVSYAPARETPSLAHG
jgi:hypothetical protein